MLTQSIGRLWCLSILVLAAFSLGGMQSIVTSVQAAEAEPIVSVTDGQIRGRHAQIPVGDLRWHEPLPVKPWDAVRDAREFGAPCAQLIAGDWNRHDAELSHEDCLYLNVLAPGWPPKQRWPVMFWLHGGGNTGGAAFGSLY